MHDRERNTMRDVEEIRLQGRGGQGIVTAGELLGKAAILEGKHAQSVPTFGPERRGALSSCSLRIAERPILLKCSATTANVLCLLDPTIWHFVDITAGLLEGSRLVFNTTLSPEEIDDELRSGKHGYVLPLREYSIFTVDATSIALEVLGRPITNTAMMGAFAGATGLVRADSIAAVLGEKFGDRAGKNVESAEKASEALRSVHRSLEGAPAARPVAPGAPPGKAKGLQRYAEYVEHAKNTLTYDPGWALDNATGAWRARRPVKSGEKCNDCALCWFYCPEGCIAKDGFVIDYTYCKGCGICATECRAGAIVMEREGEPE
jgi:2-oxoacid:acceptor oxidoreductase gamma subunit (pyruvate/2-ketoisovalerate family)/2-oxoacid:acceptor oxidoreductase delta subunit (pyruvate/2-ketoisovalerate family)